MYDCKCDIIEKKEIIAKDGSNELIDVVVYAGIPCRLSYEEKNKSPTVIINNVASNTQIIKLFIAPEIIVKPSSKIKIKKNKKEVLYKSSSPSAIYDTHQEILLELNEVWS